MLKADFHAHSRQTQFEANYSPEQLIDKAAELGYEVFTISEHYEHNSENYRYRANPIANFQRLNGYAKKKGILLIPGAEATIEGKEILILNIKGDAIRYLTTFDKLKELKKKDPSILVIAPHPYYGKSLCLKGKMKELLGLIDAVEYCHFYMRWINPNKKAVEFAKKHNKPMVGTSDAHRFVQLGKTYTLVNAKKDIGSVVEAVKKGKIEIKTRPLTIVEFSQVFFFVIEATLRRRYEKFIDLLK